MDKPLRPKVFPTEASIQPPPLATTDLVNTLKARIALLERVDAGSQRMLTRALYENRVRDECLEIAMEALNWYGRNCPVLLCGKAGEALIEIERRLAEMEPEAEMEKPECTD